MMHGRPPRSFNHPLLQFASPYMLRNILHQISFVKGKERLIATIPVIGLLANTPTSSSTRHDPRATS